MSDIIIQGARENNLKNINVRIPRGRLTVITGVSGGKSQKMHRMRRPVAAFSPVRFLV